MSRESWEAICTLLVEARGVLEREVYYPLAWRTKRGFNCREDQQRFITCFIDIAYILTSMYTFHLLHLYCSTSV